MMKIALIGETILQQAARTVTAEEFAQPELLQFAEDLLNTMYQAKGIGIAAPQVFDPRAMMYLASRPNVRYPDAPYMEPLLLINPQIIEQSAQQVLAWEGCLSVPGLRGNVSRPDWVTVQYQNLTGDLCHQRFEGFVARVFLHEYDHLLGLTWLDHVKDSKHIMANEVWQNALEQGWL